ncbi:hypothetical protein ACFL6U_28620 [Planctomycetota bacterium]
MDIIDNLAIGSRAASAGVGMVDPFGGNIGIGAVDGSYVDVFGGKLIVYENADSTNRAELEMLVADGNTDARFKQSEKTG